MCTDILILAGGLGERLWPISNTRKPKQFMTLSGGETFLQSAIRRALALNISGKIYIITRKEWVQLVITDILNLIERMHESPVPASKFLVMSEPFGKNTAPAITWLSKYLQQSSNQAANLLMMASDHIIQPMDAFIADVEKASCFSDKNNLVTFSIKPDVPSIGYGYIKTGESIPDESGKQNGIFKIESFREKPDEVTARSYLKDGRYYWNSGIYAFRTDFYLSELSKKTPEIFNAFSSLEKEYDIECIHGIQVLTNQAGLYEAYERTPALSIDYALSEKCSSAVTIRASFSWDDVGTWDSLTKYPVTDSKKSVLIQSENCYINSDIPVALCGVEDLIVVIKNGEALVCKKGKSDLTKDALACMKTKTTF